VIPASFETVDEIIPVGEGSFVITRIASIDRLYDDLVARGPAHEDVADERIPYWADLWPSAVGLAQYLHAHPELVSGKTVLEIGCGLGLPGIVASALGGRVTMTDYLEEALAMAGRNAERNRAKGVAFRKMDWRRPDASLTADVLLASDVAYEKRSFEPLPHAISTLLGPGGLALVSEPGRAFAKPFFDSLARDFDSDVANILVEYRGLRTGVSVYVLRKKN
jgi:predicted nicotinamide N-methyase